MLILLVLQMEYAKQTKTVSWLSVARSCNVRLMYVRQLFGILLDILGICNWGMMSFNNDWIVMPAVLSHSYLGRYYYFKRRHLNAINYFVQIQSSLTEVMAYSAHVNLWFGLKYHGKQWLPNSLATWQAENIDNKHATDHFIFNSLFVVYDSNTWGRDK